MALPDTLAPKSSVRIPPAPPPYCSSVLPLRRAQASPDPLRPASLHRGSLGPKGAFFFSCCSNRRSPESWGLEKLGRPCLGKLLTQNVQFQTFSSPSKCTAPNYFMTRITAKETLESSFPWCLAPAEKGWHQGLKDFGRCPPSAARSFPPGLPFFLTLSPPLRPPAPTQTVCTGSLPL